MSSSNFTFPSPVGGVPLASDYAPSILFAILYGLLVPVAVWRLCIPKTRTIAVIGTFVFAVERVVIFALRSEQSKRLQSRDSNGLARYMQTTFAVGYVNISTDLVMLMRSLLAAAASSRRSSDTREPSIPLTDINGPSQTSQARLIPETVPALSASEADTRKKESWWNGRIGSAMQFLCLVSLTLGTVQGVLYPNAEKDRGKARLIQQLRYASSGVICATLTTLQVFSVYCAFTIRNIHRYPTYLITALVTLMNIITVYRMVVMVNQTTSVDSLAPGSLNLQGAKAAFYVFHVAPEWITAAVLIAINIKERFETGFWGQHWPSKNKPSTIA